MSIYYGLIIYYGPDQYICCNHYIYYGQMSKPQFIYYGQMPKPLHLLWWNAQIISLIMVKSTGHFVYYGQMPKPLHLL